MKDRYLVEFSENKIHNFHLNEKLNGVDRVEFNETLEGKSTVILKLNEVSFKYKNLYLLKPSDKHFYMLYKPSSSSYTLLAKVKVLSRFILDTPPHVSVLVELEILNRVKEVY